MFGLLVFPLLLLCGKHNNSPAKIAYYLRYGNLLGFRKKWIQKIQSRYRTENVGIFLDNLNGPSLVTLDLFKAGAFVLLL